MSVEAIWGLVLRYIFLYTRNAIRIVELLFWPVMELLVWGFLTIYIRESSSGSLSEFIVFLIGAMILWDVLFRSQQGVAISFLEDVWTRNLLNVFVAPVRITEYLAATFVIGFLRILVTVTVLAVLAAVMYQFNLFSLGLALIPFFANLLVFGWCLGMISTALILRWGQAAEALAWAVPFFIQPVSAVFYPVAVLPSWLQAVAWMIPSTHVFEGMRGVLDPKVGVFSWESLAWATGLNAAFAGLTALFFAWILRLAREQGLLTKFASH
jgi:ABC-2 type transport system permease protein